MEEILQLFALFFLFLACIGLLVGLVEALFSLQGFLVLSGIVVLLFFTLRTLFAGKTAKSGKSLGGAKRKHGILKIDENQIDKG